MELEVYKVVFLNPTGDFVQNLIGIYHWPFILLKKIINLFQIMSILYCLIINKSLSTRNLSDQLVKVKSENLKYVHSIDI